MQDLNLIHPTFEQICDQLFGTMRMKNQEILNLYEKNNEVGFKKAIDFAISSNAISIIKALFYENNYSHTFILMLRNIIECFALRKMYEVGKISKENEELLKYTGFIVDYNMYKDLDFKEEDFGKILDYNVLCRDFKHALEKYKEYGISEKQLKKMKIPFLLDKKMTYNKIIEQYCPEFSNYYNLLSFYIHPHRYNIEELEKESNIILICCFILLYLVEIYEEDIEKYSVFYTFKLERNLLLSNSGQESSYANQFLKDCFEECKIVNKLANKLVKKLGSNNYLVNLLWLFPQILMDIATDSIHGQTENIKMKFKTIIEIFALYDWLFFGKENLLCEDSFYMVNCYTYIKLNEVDNKPNDELLKEASEYFKKKYGIINFDEKKFNETFITTLGFTIDKNYEKSSLNSLIINFVKKNFDSYISEQKIKRSTLYKIFYAESCSLGHGNAYCIYSNTGAFLEETNVFVFLDEMLDLFLSRYAKVLECMELEEYKGIVISINNACVKINRLSKEKFDVLQKKIKFSFDCINNYNML